MPFCFVGFLFGCLGWWSSLWGFSFAGVFGGFSLFFSFWFCGPFVYTQCTLWVLNCLGTEKKTNSSRVFS